MDENVINSYESCPVEIINGIECHHVFEIRKCTNIKYMDQFLPDLVQHFDKIGIDYRDVCVIRGYLPVQDVKCYLNVY